jgi:hypothetical protein
MPEPEEICDEQIGLLGKFLRRDGEVLGLDTTGGQMTVERDESDVACHGTLTGIERALQGRTSPLRTSSP